MPLINKLCMKTPESLLFQNPVDIKTIPTYTDIISKPIDLGTIKDKLTNGVYTNPYELVDDVRQMFTNAWTFNKKNTKVYEYSTKVRFMI
jgi:hypothetical protein